MHVNGKIKYKGDCIQGDIPHGNGSMYHYNGHLMFSGNFKNGEINDKNSKVYHFNGHLEYEGAMEEGRKEGIIFIIIFRERGPLS